MPLDLNNPKVLEAIKWQANRVVLFDLLKKAHQIVLNLPKMLMETPVERAEDQFAYQDILAQAKFTALPLLGGNDIVELLQNNFVQIFELPDYDLWGKFKTKLITLPRFEDRDDLKRQAREALLSNNQVLTSEELILDAKSVKGTVKNWLTDYHQTLGTGKVETLKLSQYLVNTPNTKKLSDQSRKKLEYLLRFYEKLKISSATFEGVEESIIFNVDGELEIYEGGKTERIGRDAKEILKRLEGIEIAEDVETEIEERYLGSAEEAKKVEEEKTKIFKTTAGDFKKLSDLLFRVVNPLPGKSIDKIQVEAILKVLAEKNELEKLLEEKRFNKMMVEYFKESNKTVELDGFKINPRGPHYVGIFLRYLLEDRVGLSENESGRIGMQLFNILAKGEVSNKYIDLVYFDLETREFKWA